jgi:cadherin 23
MKKQWKFLNSSSCPEHRTKENRLKSLLVSCLLTLLFFSCCVSANSPPKFVLDQNTGPDIVIRLKEGRDTPPGTVIYRAKAFDPDGDPLTFGVISRKDLSSSDIVDIVNENGSYEASLVLKRPLDAESETEHQLVLTLTDDRLGNGNFITQSLLIVVEDTNDNVPIFESHTPSILVREHSATPLQLARLKATDLDSGIFGQVIYTLESDDPNDLKLFSVSTVDNRAELKLVGDLDYERQTIHQLRILATDRANFGRVNTATTGLLIRVQDIEDNPPNFVIVPSVTRIAEDVPTFTEVRSLYCYCCTAGKVCWTR